MNTDSTKAYYCSQQQTRILQLGRMNKRCAAQAVIKVLGRVNREKLEQAWKNTALTNDALLTKLKYSEENSCGYQMVHTSPSFVVNEMILGVDDETQSERIGEIAGSESSLLSDREPLARLLVIHVEKENKTYVVISLPGYCCDTEGIKLVIKGLFKRYNNPESKAVKSCAVDYLQYSEWQNSILHSDEAKSFKEYWRTEEQYGEGSQLFLPDGLKGGGHGRVVSASRVELESGIVNGLVLLSERWGVRKESLIYTSLLILLARLSGVSKFGLWVDLDGRVVDDVKETIGLFTHRLPISVEVTGDRNIQTVATTIDSKIDDALDRHEFYCGEENFSELGNDGNLPLCAEWVSLDIQQLPGVDRLEIVELRAGDLNYAIKLRIVESKGATYAEWTCPPENEYVSAVANLADQWHHCLKVVLDGPKQHVAKMDLLGKSQRRLLLDHFVGKPHQHSGPPTFLAVFEEQVRSRPDSIALSHARNTYTYSLLDKLSSDYAVEMMNCIPGGIVGIDAYFSANSVILMLAAMKAGLAYLPVNVDQPTTGLQGFLSATGERLTVFGSDAGRLALLANAENMDFQVLDKSVVSGQGKNRLSRISGNSIAYVVMTSGSTGTPKAVLVTHNNLLQSTFSRLAYYPEMVSRFLLLSPLYVDSSVAGIYWTLATGGELVIPSEEERGDPGRVTTLVNELSASHLLCVPSFYRYILDEIKCEGGSSLSVAIVAAEACTRSLVLQHMELLPDISLYNEYGPSETTVWASAARCDGDASREVSIGKPVSHASIYILDSKLCLVPVGQTGEIYIGGHAVSLGYWARPDETGRRFIPDPFSERVGSRLYRTGDHGYWRADGSLVFTGRSDEQVKIRGFRVEIGEIRQVLEDHPDVREAYVKYSSEDKKIIAYVVMGGATTGNNASQLFSYLENRLPHYACPGSIYLLDELPRLPGGKVDAGSLLDIKEHSDTSTGSGPRDPMEELVISVWKECLACKSVGRDDDYFALGGHSLNGIQVISRIRDILGTDHVGIQHLLQNSVASEFASVLKGISRRTDFGETVVEEEHLMLVQPPAVRHLPASFFQERLFFLQALNLQSAAYNCPFALWLTGPLDVALLERCLMEILERHCVLRTRFYLHGGEVKQSVSGIDGFKLEIYEQSDRDEKAAEQWALREGEKPFDLQSDPLIRMKLMTCKDERNLLLIVAHHTVFDGWSIELFASELVALYEQGIENRSDHGPSLQSHYSSYAYWQKRQWDRGAWSRHLEYWRNLLETASLTLELPTDKPRPPKQSFRGETIHFEFSDRLSDAIRQVSVISHVTPFMVLEALLSVVLNYYTGQDDILIGTPIASRHRKEVEPLIGPVANTVVIRNTLTKYITWSQLLIEVRKAVLDAHENQDVPFEKIIETLGPERTMSHSPVFQVMLVMQNGSPDEFKMGNIECQLIRHQGSSAKFDMTVSFFNESERILAQLEYDTDLFERDSMERFIQNLQYIADIVISNPDTPLSGLDFSRPDESRKIAQWNNTEIDNGAGTLVTQFEGSALSCPDSTALRYGKVSLSYGELNSRANMFAHFLRNRGLGSGQIVGLFMDRSVELVISILGILKCGCSYLPLDKDYPPDRLKFMWKQAGRPFIIADSTSPSAGFADNKVIYLKDVEAEVLKCADHSMDGKPQPDQLAYVIYTSGSTGVPKGVMVSHRSIVNRLKWMQREFSLSPQDAVLHKTTYSFDVSVWELFWPLSEAATVVILPPHQHKDTKAVRHILENERIKFVHFVPSMLSVYMNSEGFNGIGQLREVICSGETLSSSVVEQFYSQNPHARLMNLYGPTEAAVDVSSWQCDSSEAYVPIGRQIDNMKLFVVNSRLRSVPIGGKGELYIGGVGLARGYLAQPAATAERFVPDMLSMTPGSRLYRSGDLARYRDDGAVVLLGRNDNQIKLRGVRIELDEIELILKTFSGIRDAVVVTIGDSADKLMLIAYVVGYSDKLSIDQITDYAKAHLPDYMIPAKYLLVENLPQLPNGKIDRLTLSREAMEQLKEQPNDHAVMTTDTQRRLAPLWEQFLHVHTINVDAGFFEEGGHSLMAISLLSEINRQFSIDMSLNTFLESRSFMELARQIDNLRWLSNSSVVNEAPVNGSHEIHGRI